MKNIVLSLKRKSMIQEIVNCWLRYALSQPVNIDIQILVMFTLQYFGLSKIGPVLEQLSVLASELIENNWSIGTLAYELRGV